MIKDSRATTIIQICGITLFFIALNLDRMQILKSIFIY